MGSDLDDTVVREPQFAAAAAAVLDPVVMDADTIPRVIAAPASIATLAPEPKTASLRLGFPDGRVLAIDAPVIVGRHPAAPRVPTGTAPRLVSVFSPNQEVSGTHAEFRVVGHSVVVSDLRSTNGTAVALPGARRQVLFGGQSAVVTAGAMIDLGDGVVLRVLPPDADTALDA